MGITSTRKVPAVVCLLAVLDTHSVVDATGCRFLCQSLVTSSHRLRVCQDHDIVPKPETLDICTSTWNRYVSEYDTPDADKASIRTHTQP